MRRFQIACCLLALCLALSAGSSLWAAQSLGQAERQLLQAQAALAAGESLPAAAQLREADRLLQQDEGVLLFAVPRTQLSLLRGQVAALAHAAEAETAESALEQALCQLQLLRRLLLAAL